MVPPLSFHEVFRCLLTRRQTNTSFPSQKPSPLARRTRSSADTPISTVKAGIVPRTIAAWAAGTSNTCWQSNLHTLLVIAGRITSTEVSRRGGSSVPEQPAGGNRRFCRKSSTVINPRLGSSVPNSRRDFRTVAKRTSVLFVIEASCSGEG